MSIRARQLIVGFGPGVFVFLFSVLFAGVKAAWLGECDSKFGCQGGILFAASIGGMGALLSWIGGAGVALGQHRSLAAVSHHRIPSLVAATSVALAALFSSVPFWPIDDVWLILSWCAISAAITAVFILIASRAVT